MDVTKRSTFRWALAAIFAAMLMLVLTPAGAWAAAAGTSGGGDNQSATDSALTAGATALQSQDDAAVTTAHVDFTSQMTGAFLHAPQFGVGVASNEAELFGYTDEVDGVSVLDVLVKAHEIYYGDAFTAETAKQYLTISEYGSPTKQFGEEPRKDDSTGYSVFYGGFYLNHAMANDGTMYDESNYNATTVTTQAVVDGDFVEFFFYESGYYGDTYTWFVGPDGYSREFSVDEGEELSLTLKGFFAMSASIFADEDAMTSSEIPSEIDGAQIYTVDASGALTEVSSAVTDEGDVSLTFNEPGEYWITAFDDEEEFSPAILTLTKVTVKPKINIDVTVSITKEGSLVTGKDDNPVVQVPVHLTGKSGYTIDDALRAVHEKCYPGGAAAGYESVKDPYYGLSLVKLWGITTDQTGYQVNHGDVSVWNLGTAIKNGDVVEAYVLKSRYPDTESYAAFAVDTAETEAGADYSVLLKEAGWDENWNMVMAPCEGATVYVYGTTGTQVFVTDSKGIAKVHFNEPGEYLLTAMKTKTVGGVEVPAITAPAMKLWVSYNPNLDVLREAIDAARQAPYDAADDMPKLIVGLVYEYANGLLATHGAPPSMIESAAKNLNTAVEAAVKSATENSDAAAKVTAMISALPEPAAATALDKKAADAAQAAYNKLTETQKKLVSEADVAKLVAVKKAADDEAANGLAKDKTFSVSSAAGTFTYKVTAKKQVTLTKAASTKAKAITVNTVKYHGVTYKVTAIGSKSLKSSKITAVTVGANVKSIGASAFSSSKVSKITVKSSQLTAVSKVKNALKGSKVKTVKMSGLKGATKTKTINAFKKAGLKNVKVS